MTVSKLISLPLACAFLFGLSQCGSSDEQPPPKPKACDPVAQSGCKDGKVCEEVSGGQPTCFAPLNIAGKVFDTVTTKGIEGAHVVARDANDAAISSVAVSDKDGAYTLRVPAPRNKDGSPVKTEYTMRADAQGYLSFPEPPRVALPVDLSTASGDPLTVKSAATDIGLVPLANTTNLGSVSGKVLADKPGGTLVVAAGSTASADTSGAYTVFNVPAGSVTVSGYLVGVNLTPATATVAAGAETKDVNLSAAGSATATVSGNVQIVNPGQGKNTSIILVVEDTFVENAARGEAPAGLRAGNVSGAYSIANVPDGKYVVLGAFENDFLVRDPDTGIGGTAIQHITVAGGPVSVTGFKITGALDVMSPDGGQEVSGNPTFTWADDTSEDSYTVQVFDALGNETWKVENVIGPKGNSPAQTTYAGTAALVSGMYYQFRATSIKNGIPISRTEDLKGVFLFK